MSIIDLITEGVGPSVDALQYINEGMSFAAASPAFAQTVMSEGLAFGGNVGCLIREGFSPYIGLPEPPTIGVQYTDITSLTFTGFSLLLANPVAALGDIFVTDLLSGGTLYPIFVNGDGTGYIDAHGDKTRQTFQSTYFSVSGQVIESPSNTIDLNDNAPQLLLPVPQINTPLGGTMNFDFVLGTPQYVLDPDGDPLTMTLADGSLPDGISISGTALVGNATTAAFNTFVLNFSDPVGAFVNVTVSVLVYAATFPMIDLTGLPQDQAIAAINAAGLLFVGGQGGQFDDVIPPGLVDGQNPLPGVSVSFGTPVSFTFSLGPSGPVPFPTIQATILVLSAAGFVADPVIAYAYSTTVPDGYVISLSPQPGSNVPINTPIQLTVSLGPPNPVLSTNIPNVVGMQLLQAQAALVAASLEVGNLSWQYGAGEINVVLSQSPVAGTVPVYTQVDLVFLAGPVITYPGQGSQTVPPLPSPP